MFSPSLDPLIPLTSFKRLSRYNLLLHYNPIVGKYCGKTLPEPVKASTQSLYIMFHSDELDAFKGFKAEWSPYRTSTQGPLTIKSSAHGKRVAL